MKISPRLIAAALLFYAPAANAEPLTDAVITKFIQSWPATTKALIALDSEFDPENLASLRAQLAQMSSVDGADSARDKAVAASGYNDFESWAAVTASIILTELWAKNPPDEKDLDAAIASIQGDTNRTEDEKKQLIEELKEALITAKAEKPDDADITAIAPHSAALETLLN